MGACHRELGSVPANSICSVESTITLKVEGTPISQCWTGKKAMSSVRLYEFNIVKSILVSDDSGSGSTITVDLFNGPSASSSKFNLYKTLAVGNNATVQLIDEPLILMENEVLEVTAANANRLHVIASILEINRNDQ